MTQPSGRQLSETEAHAVKILQAALPGVHIVPVDPGGGPRQLHDFNLERGAGDVEALEVTEATIEELRVANARRDKYVPGAALPAPTLRRQWYLIPSSQTPLAKLHRAIPLLEQVEDEIERHGLEGWPRHPAVQQLNVEFHPEWLKPWDESDDPKLIVGRAPDLRVSVENPEEPGYWIQRVVSDEANKPDNRKKLGASDAVSAICSFGSIWTTTRRGRTLIGIVCRPRSRPCPGK
jgi:hypothetical protein